MRTVRSSAAAPPGALLSHGTNLGFNDNTYYNHDRAYDLPVDPAFSSIPHTADSLTVTWRVVTPTAAGMGSQQWQGLDDESWAIDNVRVEVGDSDGAIEFPGSRNQR